MTRTPYMPLGKVGPLTVRVTIERWPLREPFRITGFTFEALEVLMLELEHERCVGRGEAAGVYYRREDAGSMIGQIESICAEMEAGLSRDSIQALLPPGGVRNALDCAWWDLESKLSGISAWERAELPTLRPLVTTFTCGADEPESMAAKARAYIGARAIKLKLTGEPIDAERIRAVRNERPDVWLAVDANQGFTPMFLDQILPTLVENRVSLIEQPFPVGQEHLLDRVRSPIPVAADESAQTLADLPGLTGRFGVVNIKLDKCGGLTEGLAMARAAKSLGLDVMVGNMFGTSLAMAPAFLLGQLCDVVDLDGATFLMSDRANPARYLDGLITCPETLWGNS